MSLATLAHRHPRIVDWGIHIDRTPAAGWLALQFAALMPTWAWMVQRMRDGSDDPMGLLALVALAALAWNRRRELRASPRLGWLALAGAGTVLATLLRTGLGPVPALPPLAAGLVAVLAMACALLAFLPRGVAALPVAGLSVLALPLLSSLQFYAGYPLRVVTAEVSRWLLAPGFEVAREGATLLIDGRLVIVDAPCSGVQMVWLGYFTACAVALWAGRSNHGFARRLPMVGLLVLAGNIVRNSVLIACEGAGHALAPWAHDALGLLVLAAVCGAISRLMVPARPAPEPAELPIAGLITTQGGRHVDTVLERWFANHFINRIGHKTAFALAMVLCMLWSAAAAVRAPTEPTPALASHEWPSTWDGATLRPLALSEVEQRFADRFPGAIGRMTDGTQTLVLREVTQPTRMLHPAADCYRALGWRIAQARLERDAQERMWRCFVAQRHGAQKIRVCERIVDARGAAFTDTSAWYWAAASGQSHGPWQAVTVARPI